MDNNDNKMIFQQLEYLPPGRVFAWLYNLRALVLGRPTRVMWDGIRYRITDPNLTPPPPALKYSLHLSGQAQRRLFFTYNRGIKAGAMLLAQNYHLPEIDFSDGDIVLDCGANMGDIKLYLDTLPQHIRYIGFEPDPIDFACLAHNIKQGVNKHKAEAHNIGLWREAGSLPFYISPRGSDSSFIQPPHYDKVVEIPARPLADFMPKNKDSRVRLLKLEAEGAELEVLEGLGETLGRIDYIAATLGAERGIKQEATFIPVVNFLLCRGFAIAHTNDSISDSYVLFKNRDT